MCKPKFLYWLTSRGAYATRSPRFNASGTGNPISPNSMTDFQVMFNQLPEARAYRLKCEQFSINSTGAGIVHELPIVGALTNAGIPCATGLVELVGISPINGSVVSESASAFATNGNKPSSGTNPPQQRCYITRFDTSFMSTENISDCSVSPPHSPEVLIHRPTNGTLGVNIKGIAFPEGLLCLNEAGPPAVPRRPIGDWVMCLSFEPMTDKELDGFYNINQHHDHA